jgi:precorrin-6B methylase 2
MKKLIKSLLFGTGMRPVRIRAGLYRGLDLYLDPSHELLICIGIYEAETFGWLRMQGPDMRSLIDVGAGCGELSMWALRHPQVEQVDAYDPSPHRWPVFDENQRLNGFAADRRLRKKQDFFLEPRDHVATLQLLEELPEPVLIRIDVDGGEADILRQMRDLLLRKDLRLLIETHSQELDSDCRRILRDCGYRVHSIGRAWWRCILPEKRPIGFNQWLVAERDRGRGQ